MDEFQAVASIVGDLGTVGVLLAWVYNINKLYQTQRERGDRLEQNITDDWKADKQSGRVPTLSQPRPIE